MSIFAKGVVLHVHERIGRMSWRVPTTLFNSFYIWKVLFLVTKTAFDLWYLSFKPKNIEIERKNWLIYIASYLNCCRVCIRSLLTSIGTLINNYGAIHTSELDRSQIDLSPKLSECEHSNANWDRSKIDLNECQHFLKANWGRSQIDPT